MSEYISRAPNYKQHRKDIAAVDITFDEKTLGIDCENFNKAHIQVVPANGANPTVKVYWWSEAFGEFIREHVEISKAGVGANIPFEFTVDCEGRTMFVAITTLASGDVSVYVAGSNNSLER